MVLACAAACVALCGCGGSSGTGAGTGGSSSFTLSVQPSSLSLVPGVSQPVQITAVVQNGFNGLVTGTLTGLPNGVTTNSTTFNFSPGSSSTIYFTAAAGAGAGTVMVSATAGTLSASGQVSISVDTTPDFGLTTGGNPTVVISQNASQSLTISATPYNGFSQPISVSFSGVPTGVSISPASFALEPGTTQAVTISTSFSAAVTTGASIVVTGNAGTISHELDVSLIVQAPSLSLSTQPNGLTVAAGSTNSFLVQLLNSVIGTPLGSISVEISSSVPGLQVSPTTYTSGPQGTELTVFVAAPASGTSGGAVTVKATYGPVVATGSMGVLVGPANNFPPVSLNTSDQLIRVDTATPYYTFPPPNYLIYHSATQRFFSTDAWLNKLYVVDANTRALTATLTIPGAFGLDQAPDGSVIYVGTMLGDVYVVDPVHLTILQRYASSSIGASGFAANAVYALADGKLILETYFLVPGYSWVDGNGPIALWDPQTNSLTVFGGPTPSAGQVPSCFGRLENVMLTNNRTRVLLSPVLTSEGSSQLCSLDPEADTWNMSSTISGGTESSLTAFAITSDGSTLIAYDGYNVYSLNATTLAVMSSFPLATPISSVKPTNGSTPILLVSQDNSSVFITDPNGPDVFDEYNLSTGQFTGWISQLNVAYLGSYAPVQPMYEGVSSNGLAAGVIPGGGIGLLDLTAVHAPPIGSRFTQTQLDVPFGPISGGTATEWAPEFVGVPAPPLGSIYFGTNAATGINNGGFEGYLEGMSPPGNSGPVDVRTFATDGGSQLIPDGFSYGPWVLEAPTTYSTAEGGGPGSLFGYGFGPQAYTGGALYIASPAGLQVTVNGTVATVGSYSPNPYGSDYFTTSIFPSNALRYTIPPGTAGTAATIQVNNSTGSTSASQPMTYLPAIQQYPVPGQLADGVYDTTRDVYYFADATEIRVFSVAQGSWLAPIPIPAPTGAYGPQRLYGLAMSPDGSKLAVSDPGAIAIYVVDLNQPASIQSFALAGRPPIGDPLSEEPAGIAITNSGTVYISTYDLDGDGGCGYMLALQTSTGDLSNAGPSNENGCLPTQGASVNGFAEGRFVTSADGSRIYFNDAGILGYIDTASGQVVTPINNDSILGQGGYEIALDPNSDRLFADGFFTDTNLNSIGLQTVNVAESLDAEYVYGGVFSSDGDLFFQPGSQAIDVFDGRTGAFQARVALPVQLSANYRALISDGQDNQIVAITGTGDGIAVIDLSALPDPGALSWLSAMPAPLLRNPGRAGQNHHVFSSVIRRTSRLPTWLHGRQVPNKDLP